MKNTYRITMMVFGMMATIALQADTITWTGGGAGTSWNDVGNWDAGVPTSADEAVFTDTGLSADEVITLDAVQSIDTLTFNTTTEFTIGDATGNTAGHTLTLNAVNRMAGCSGDQTIKADIVLANDTLWTVNGSDLLIASLMTGSGKLEKNGTGELRLSSAHSSARTGATVVNQGILGVNGSGDGTNPGQMGAGDITVGNGIDSAVFELHWGSTWNFNCFGNDAVITVNSNGVFDLETYCSSAGNRSDSIKSIEMNAGGEMKIGKYTLGVGSATTTNVLMTGGIISGVGGGKLSFTSGYAVFDSSATEMATISAGIPVAYKYSGGTLYTRFSVTDVPGIPVELKVTGLLVNLWDDRDGFYKMGAGVMKITGENTYGGRSTSSGRTRVLEGTLLVDNLTGSGTGLSYVPVSGGATLGGIGTIGGVNPADFSNVNLAGVSGASLAILAPGTIDETTGDHINGTLTVGSVVETNNVTFADYSQLSINIGAGNEFDSLNVYGIVDLSSADDTLNLNVSENSGSGNYTIVSAANGVSGIFDTVTGLPSGAEVVYDANNITLAIPARGTFIIIR